MDTLVGTDAAGVMEEFAGDDVITGGAAVDELNGAAGDDDLTHPDLQVEFGTDAERWAQHYIETVVAGSAGVLAHALGTDGWTI